MYTHTTVRPFGILSFVVLGTFYDGFNTCIICIQHLCVNTLGTHDKTKIVYTNACMNIFGTQKPAMFCRVLKFQFCPCDGLPTHVASTLIPTWETLFNLTPIASAYFLALNFLVHVFHSYVACLSSLIHQVWVTVHRLLLDCSIRICYRLVSCMYLNIRITLMEVVNLGHIFYLKYYICIRL